MNTPHKWQKEIHAFADGKVIQYRVLPRGGWVDSGYRPDFSDPVLEFRIKPELKTITYRIALVRRPDGICIPIMAVVKTEDQPRVGWSVEMMQRNLGFIKWITEETTVEIPE